MAYAWHESARRQGRFWRISRSICLEHVPEVVVGDYILAHVGFALARIDEEEAMRIFALLEEGDFGELGDASE